MEKIEVDEPSDRNQDDGCADEKTARRQPALFRFKGIPRVENQVKRRFPLTDVRPLTKMLLEPHMHFFWCDLLGHLKAPESL